MDIGWMPCFILIVLLLPWEFFIRSIIFQSQFYQDLLFFFFPIFIIAGFIPGCAGGSFVRRARGWIMSVPLAHKDLHL